MFRTSLPCWMRATPSPLLPVPQGDARHHGRYHPPHSGRPSDLPAQPGQAPEEVKASIEGQGKLTEELSAAIDAAATLAEVEDLYRPYKPKRRTRATIAKEKGLEPLAQLLFAQGRDCPAPEVAAADYVDPEKGVNSGEEVLAGASDIIAEAVSDDAELRKRLRELWRSKGSLVSRGGGQGAGGHGVPPVLRLYHTRLPGHGPPDSGH